MGEAKITTGIILLVIGLAFLFLLPWLGIALIILGLLFIIFHADEEKIEERKDLSPLKNRNKNKRN